MEDARDREPLLGGPSRVADPDADASGRTKNAAIAVLAVLFVAAVAVIAVLVSKESINPDQESTKVIQDNLALNIRTSLGDGAEPCHDFYSFACGGWLASTYIPPEKNTWSRSFSVIHERALSQMREILEESDKTLEARFYQSCMDEAAVNQRGISAVQPLLDMIEQQTAEKGALVMSATLLREGVGSLMSIGVEVDMKSPQEHVLAVSQGGLGLPDRQYYFDEAQSTIRDDYVAHVAKVLELSGVAQEAAQADARAIMDFETRLAEISLRREEMRDPEKLYNKKGLDQIMGELAPGLDWVKYFSVALDGDAEVTLDLEVNVATPTFLAGLPTILNTTATEHVKSYLRWHTLHSYSSAMHDGLRAATFEFYGQRLSGQEQQPPRWKKCVAMTDDAVPDAVSKTYVDLHFSPADKTAAQDLIRRVEDAFKKHLSTVRWMDNSTRDATVEKLDMIANNVGYPDRWVDYSSLDDKLGANFFENEVAARKFDLSREFKKLSKPVDRGEWEMSAPTVNAYYDPSKNKMVFPAGILQYPFFERTAPAAVNFGAIGSVMGHELTHAFDDEGRKFDGYGRLRDWWAPTVVDAFDKETKCVEDQFSGYPVPGATDGSMISGKLTLGENIADLGGVKAAYQAFQQYKHTRRLTQASIDHPPSLKKFLSEDQLFFVSYAQSWCEHVRDQYAGMLAKTDPHSPPHYRVMGPLANVPEFAAAFGCNANDTQAFVRSDETRCQVW
jgi:predicted metalloendopeptidase